MCSISAKEGRELIVQLALPFYWLGRQAYSKTFSAESHAAEMTGIAFRILSNQ